MASKIWPAFMLEPEWQRELEEAERAAQHEWEEAQDAAARVAADLFEEGSPA